MTRALFEWDSKKDQENQQKHGVSFALAQYAFADSQRIIAEDVNHSKTEKRYYCWQGRRWHSHCALYVSEQCDPHNWSRLLAERQGDL